MVFVGHEKLFGIVRTPIGYVALHFRFRRGAASPRYRNRTEITVVCVNKRHIRYGFRAPRKAVRYSTHTYRICGSPL